MIQQLLQAAIRWLHVTEAGKPILPETSNKVYLPQLQPAYQPIYTQRSGIQFFLILLLIACSSAAYGQIVSSDKDDYSPGETAIITGSGWYNDQMVHVEFKEEPDYPDYHAYDVSVDENGDWMIKYAIEARHLGVKFTVNVSGMQSGAVAHTYFTDGELQITNISVSPFSPNHSPAIKDLTEITLKNVGTGTENQSRIRIRQGLTNGTIVYETNNNSLAADASVALNWNGKYNVGANTGNYVPDGLYYAIAYNAKSGGTETLRAATPPVYRTVIVDNTTPLLAVSSPLATARTFCGTGSTVTISGTASDPLVNSVNSGITSVAMSYNLNGGNAISLQVSGTTAWSSSLVLSAVGTYVIETKVTDGAGNSNTESITLTVSAAPSTPIAFYNTPVVYGQTLHLSASAIAGATYNWTGPKGFVSNIQNPGISNITLDASGIYSVTATVNGCISLAGTIEVSIDKANQTITFNKPVDKIFGDASFTLDATSSSGLPVNYSISSIPSGIASISNNILTILGAGSITVTASQAGDGNYNGAPNVEQTFSVAKAQNIISFSNPGQQIYAPDATVSLAASATSGASVSFSVVSGNATIDGSTLTITGAGDVTVKASSAATANYLAADDVEYTFTVQKAGQTILFTPLSAHTFGDADFALTATASSSLDVSYTCSNTDVATVSGNTLTIVGVGTTTITATQAGNSNYNAAISVPQELDVHKAIATITLSNLEHTYDGTVKSAVASTSPEGLSGVSILYFQDQTEVAPANVIQAGTYTVKASLNNANYELEAANNPTIATLVINKATAILNLDNLTHTYDGTIKSATATTTPANLSGVSISNNDQTNAGTYTVTASLENANYEATPVTEDLVIAKASSTTLITVSDGIYNGNVQGATAEVTGVNLNESLNSITYAGIDGTLYGPSTNAPMNAGTYSATATYEASANHLGSTDSKTFTIDKATPVITATAASNLVYDATAKAGSGAAKGVTNEELTPAVDLEYVGTGATSYGPSASAPTDAGTYTVTAYYAGNENYVAGISSAVAFTISKATATITVEGTTVTYDGEGHGATGTASGVNGEILNAYLSLGDKFTDFPGGTANWTFTHPNYEDESGSVAITINKAEATILVSGYNGTFDGEAHGASGSATGVKGEDLSNLLSLGDKFTNVPGGTANWSFAGNTNYIYEEGTAAIEIEQAGATIIVDGYNGIYDGDAHGASGTATGVKNEDLNAFLQLGATFTNVPGGTANWSFSHPNYTTQSGQVAIEISQASATIAVTGYDGIYDSEAHGASGSATGVKGEDLSNLLSLGDTFTNVPGGTANWSFAGNTNYIADNGSVSINIGKADATIAVEGKTVTYDGNAHGASGTATGVKGEALSGLDLGASFTDFPGGTANWTFINSNYEDESGSVAIVINKATATIAIEGKIVTYDGEAHGASGSATGVNGEDLSDLLSLGASFINVPGGTATWNFAGNTNYEAAGGTVNIVINQATPVFADLAAPGIQYNESYTLAGKIELNNLNPTGQVKISVGTKSQTVTITNGAFTANFLADAGLTVPNSPFVITYDYLGDNNFKAITDNSKELTVNKADATLALSNLTHTYDGTAKSATVTTSPAGLSGVSITYNGNTSAPTEAGTYAIVASLTNDNYTANNITGSLTIEQAKPVFATLSAPTIQYNAAFTLGGEIIFNNLKPTGQVKITIGGTSQTVTIANGVFTANFSANAALTVVGSPYGITYEYLGDNNFIVIKEEDKKLSVEKALVSASVTVKYDPGKTSVQYSDVVTLEAAITSVSAQSEINSTGAVVKFYHTSVAEANLLGTVSAAGLVNGIATGNFKINLPAATYPVLAVFTSQSFNLSGATSPSISMLVSAEDADIVYSGSEYFATANSSSSLANVEYIATFTDRNDVANNINTRGDITKAKAAFRIGNPPVAGALENLPVNSLVAVPYAGTARSGVHQVNIGSDYNNGGRTFEVFTFAQGGFYTGQTAEATLITVAVPGTDYVNGGGNMVIAQSGGTYAATAGSKMNFGFTMKWNKSGKNIQGQANIIFRRWVNGVWRTYQIKSNAINTLGTFNVTGGRRADFNTKANVTDVTNPLSPISLGGGLDLTVQAFESTVKGVKDRFSVTVRNGGVLIFSSFWNGSASEMKDINGGAIKVLSNTSVTTARSGAEVMASAESLSSIQVTAYPNPFYDKFTVSFGKELSDEAVITITDMKGSVVYQKNLPANSRSSELVMDLTNFHSGTYIVQTLIGTQRVVIKIIKY